MQTTAAAVVRRIGAAPLLIIESGLQSSSSKSVVQLHQQRRRRYYSSASTTTTITTTRINNNNDNTDNSRSLLQPPIIPKKKFRIIRRMVSTSRSTDEQHQPQEEDPKEQEQFDSLIDQHYGGGGSLREKISRGLKATSGKSLDDDELLHLDELAPISEFHSRGREGTLDLCQLLNNDNTTTSIKASDQILDVGCGLGGTARYLCSVYGATVMGIDLTQEFIDVGQELNEKVGIMADKVKLVQGSALDLPFSDNMFDIAWTEHVQMNIADKERFYGEIARVLKPNGRLVFHDVFRGTAPEPPMYPTPWAETEEMSKLATEVEIRAALAQSGLAITNWLDQTTKTVSYFQTTLSKIAERGGPPPLGIHLLMGSTAKIKLQNHLLNNEQGRTMVVMCTAVKE